MKIETTTGALRTALEACAKVSPKRDARPILEAVRITSDGDSSIEGTDLECYVRATLAASTIEVGTMVVGLRDLLDFVKAAEGETVTLSCGEESPTSPISATTDLGESIELCTFDVDEFPSFPERGPDERHATMDAVQLSRALVRAVPAMARDAGRYAMHGAQFEFPEDNAVRIVTTDGHRLHVVEVLDEVETFGLEFVDGESRGLGLLPNTGCKALTALLPKKYKKGQKSSVAALSYSECTGKFWFVLDSVTLTVRAIDGEFPRYSSILPGEGVESILLLDCTELLKRTKLVSAACSDDTATVRITRDGDTLSVVGKSVGKESCAELRGASIHSWPTFEDDNGEVQDRAGFAVNPDYLADTVKATQADRVEVRWNNPQSPIEFRAQGFRGILMPITIG
jgi:DNA polymerase III beta subunit